MCSNGHLKVSIIVFKEFFFLCVYTLGSRSYVDMLQRVKELCRYLPGLEGDTRSRCYSQVVICASLVLFRSAFLYVSSVQPALFQGQSSAFSRTHLLIYSSSGYVSLLSFQLMKDQVMGLCLAGVNAVSSGPWILVEDLSSVYNDVEVERGAVKHAHKKRKLADGREKTMVRMDQILFKSRFHQTVKEGSYFYTLEWLFKCFHCQRLWIIS